MSCCLEKGYLWKIIRKRQKKSCRITGTWIGDIILLIGLIMLILYFLMYYKIEIKLK